ncbi:MAG: DinB family protein [Candidatus Acidiferrales bacterium]
MKRKGGGREKVGLLLEILEQGYQRKTWHGPNLKQSIRRVSACEAAWRPGKGRHNIWEELVHAAYWKYVVRRRLLQEKRGSFALKGNNWFARDDAADEAAWERDRELLEASHQKLREAVEEMPQARFDKKAVDMILGVAFHDVYHAGQIRMLRRLQGKRG